MKRILSILLGILLGASALMAANPIASLTVFLGDVNYKSKNESKFVSVSRGMLFYEGDRILTRDNGKAEVFFSNGTVVNVGYNSELVFQQDQNKKKRSLYMFGGKTWNKVVKGSQFEVESVHGVAAVKGTEFVMDVTEGDMKTTILEGIVEVSNKQGSVTGQKNTQITIQINQAPVSEPIKTKAAAEQVISVEVKDELALQFTGLKKAGLPIMLTALLKDKKTGTLKKGTTEIQLGSAEGKLLFGSSQAQSYSLLLKDGKGETIFKGPAGEHTLEIKGGTIMGEKIPIKIESKIKRVILEVDSKKSNAPKQILLDYESD